LFTTNNPKGQELAQFWLYIKYPASHVIQRSALVLQVKQGEVQD